MKQQLSNMLGINVKSEKIQKLPSLPVYLACLLYTSPSPRD